MESMRFLPRLVDAMRCILVFAGCGACIGLLAFLGVDLCFAVVPRDPPLQALEPMKWTVVVGAAAGALLGVRCALRYARLTAALREPTAAGRTAERGAKP